MQGRSLVSGQRRHGWLHVLFCVAVLFICVIPPGIRATPERGALDATQLPVSLQDWSHIGSMPSSNSLKAFKQGMDNYFDGRYTAALESLPGAEGAKATAIGDYILFYRGKSNLMLERNRDALHDFRTLENMYPDSPMLRESLMSQCQILLALNEPGSVLNVLGNPKAGTDSESVYYRARALEMSGEKEKAIEQYIRVYSRFPGSKYSPLAEKYLASLSPGALKGSKNYDARLQRAESLISAGNSKAARVLLVALARASSPNSKSSEKRYLLLGEAEYRMGKTSAAIPYLRKVTANDPALHSKALYLEGLCVRKLDREGEFLALRDRLLKLYPKSSDAEELCYSAATYYDVNSEPSKAREAYRILYGAYPKGNHAERALWKLALFPYFEKKYEDAALGFWKYLLAYPNPSSAGQAMYWMGRCYQKLGNLAGAKYLFTRVRDVANDSYYGQRARESESALNKPVLEDRGSVPGIDFNLVIETCKEIQLPTLTISEPDSAGTRVIDRARQLAAAGLMDLALTELRWGTRQYPQNEQALYYIMSRIYASKNDYDAAIASLRRAFPDYNNRPLSALPDEIWDILFPTRHLGIISDEATRAGIEPALVLAVIRQESGFEEDARSRANARGLMQILPSTGKILARQARVTRFNTKKLYHPETNISLGTRFLASLLRQYGKSELALAAYNAGDSRVDRWLREWGDLDMAEFVEQIPFSETRAYVKQVLNNRVRYSSLTSSGTPATR